jgi:integrase
MRAERLRGKLPTNREKREALEAQKRERVNKWTIDRLWDAYKENRERNKGLRTDEGRYKKYLKPLFGSKEPKEIVMLDVDRLKHRTLKGLSPQTVKHVLDLLKRIVNHGVKRNLCGPLPFHVEVPRVNNLKTEDLTPDQLKDLLEAIEKDENIQVKNFMKMAIFTGMRRGELFKLKWKDIDLHRGFIHIKDPKGGPDQKIPINDGTKAVLEGHVKTKSDFVFPGRGGRQRVDINKQVNKIKADAGLPKDFRPLHGLRHSYASMLASSGKVDMYVLQKLLTHKDSRMTQRYAHLRDETFKRGASVAGDLINEIVKENEKSEEANGGKKIENHTS